MSDLVARLRVEEVVATLRGSGLDIAADLIEDALEEIERLAARVAQLEADGARLDWLGEFWRVDIASSSDARSRCYIELDATALPTDRNWLAWDDEHGHTASGLREAIDAARGAGRE